MSLIPIFNLPKKPQWRGSTSSDDMNQNFDEILYDLNSIFSEVSSLVVDLNSFESKVSNEINALNSRLASASGTMLAHDESDVGYKMLHENLFLTNNVVYPDDSALEDRCVINSQFGVATLPINNSFSKVYSVNISNGQISVAPDIIATVTPIDETGNIRIEETNILNSFDNDDKTVWERKVRFDRDYVKTQVQCLLTVTLPSMTNPFVNKIHVRPYPEGSSDIQMLTYDILVSQDNLLPTFPVAGENNVISKIYSFNNIQPVNLKFYLRQRNNYLEDDYKTFTYGFKEIGIEKVEYKNTGIIGVRFDLPSYETGLFKEITSLRTDPSYDNIIYKVKLYVSEAAFQAGTPLWTSDNSPITTSNQLDVRIYSAPSIWVTVDLTQSDGNTGSPLFKSVTLTYTTT